MGKGENAGYEHFLLFPQCFEKASFPDTSKGVIVWEWVKNEGKLVKIGQGPYSQGLVFTNQVLKLVLQFLLYLEANLNVTQLLIGHTLWFSYTEFSLLSKVLDLQEKDKECS